MALINPNNNNLLSALGSLFGGTTGKSDQTTADPSAQAPPRTDGTRSGESQDPRRQALIDEFRARRNRDRSMANPLSSASELRAASDRVRALGDSVLAQEAAPARIGNMTFGVRQPLGQVLDIFV